MSKKSNSSRLKSANKLIQDESSVISENPFAEKLQSSGSARSKNAEKSKSVSEEDQVISNSDEIKVDLTNDIFTPDLPKIISTQSEPIAISSVVAKNGNQSGSSGNADSTSNESPPHESSHNDSTHNGSNSNGSNSNGSNNSGSSHDDSNHNETNDGCETEEPEICVEQPVCEDNPDESCSLAVLTGVSVSLDESSALQNAATSIVVGDSDDNDISVSKLPAAFASRLTALNVGSPLESALSGYDGAAGKNVFNLPSGGLVAGMSLTNASGALLVGEDSGLKTLSGEAIYLSNDEINTDIVLGKTESGEIVFAVYLEQTSLPVQGGALWTVLYEPLFHNDSTNHDDQLSLDGLVFVKLDSLGSELLDTATPGQHLFFMVGDADAGYVVTGRDPANQSEGINPNKGDRVNVSNGGGSGSIGVNNQMIDPPAKSGSSQNNSGEGVVFTFVTNPNAAFTGENLSQTEADVEANIRFGGLSNVETATFTVSQTQPVKAATVKISAYTTNVETGADFIDGLLDDDVSVDVIGVKVLNSLGVVLANSDGSVVNPLIQISFNDGSAIVKGVKADYQIEYETSGTHNRVLIENPGSSDKNFNSAFDIGSFSYEQPCTEIISVGEFIVFEDSGPSTGFNPVAYLDDDALSGGNAGGISDASPNQQNTSGVLAHQFGTDGSGSIAWLTSGSPSGFDYVPDGNSLLIKQGTTTVLTLTLNTSTGAYVVTQNAAVDHDPGMNENDQVFVVGYRVSDGDGDEAEGNLLLMVDDDTPVVIQNTIVHLDDDALENGNPGGVGDANPDVLNATGSLGISFGADGPGSVSWFTTGAPAGFTYELSDDDLLVKQDGVTVMTVSFDLETSSYSVTQNAPVMHASGLDENDQNFQISFAVTDADDDTVRGTLSIRVDDDTPVVECLPIVKLDDDALPGGNPGGIGDDSPDVVNATGMLVSSFGADGPGSIEWISSGAPAGFTYQVSGDSLLIKQGVVTVITVSMDPISGSYTVVQNAPVMHPPGMNENDLALHVSYSVTDADQDCVIGSMLICIDDDTPVVSCSPVVHLDDDALPGGNPGGIGDADPDVSNASGVIAVSFGADGLGSLDWIASGAPVGFTYEVSGDTLSIKQGSTTVITALLDSETGAYSVVQNAPVMHAPGMNENDQNFLLSYRAVDADGDSVTGSIFVVVDDDTPVVACLVTAQLDDDALPGGNPGGIGDASPDTANTSGTLVFSVGADGLGSINWLTTGAPVGFTYEASGDDLLVKQGAVTVMTLTLDSETGAYTVTQNAPIMHAEGLDENDQDFSFAYLVTDADGDSARGELMVSVDDDTPVVTENALVQLDDDALAGGNPGGFGDVNPDTANTSGTLGYSFGADGAGSFAWLTTGAPTGFTYEASGDDLLVKQGAVTVMTLTLDTETGAYTVTQNAPIMHAEGLDENDQDFSFAYLVTDADGDSATGELMVSVDDDTPVVTENALVQLDDDALAGGNPGGIGDVSPDTANTTGTLGYSFGADGAGSFAWLTTGAPAGFTYEASGDDLLVKQGAVTVMTLALDTETGAYTVTQNAPIMHVEGLDENDQDFSFAYLVTDADGDSATGELMVSVDDDTPVVVQNAIVQLDDDALAGGNPGGIGDVNPDTANTSGTLGYSFGADGAGSFAWLTTGAPAGFTYEASGDDLLVKQGAVTVMTLALDTETGAYTVIQNAPIMHVEGLDENDQSFVIAYQVSDADGDTAAGQLQITVDDDTPVVVENAIVLLDDDALAGGNLGGIADASPDTQNTSGTLGYAYGADGEGSLSWLTTGAPAGFTYEASGDDLLVKQGTVTVMTLTLDTETGAYTVTQNAPVTHPTGLDENNESLIVSYGVTDADGDVAVGQLVIVVDDDTPVVTENELVILDDEILPGGVPGGIGDISPDSQNTSGTLSHSFGADGAGSISWLSTGAPAGFTYEVSDNNLYIKQGSITVVTATIDPLTGAYSTIQNSNILHPIGSAENDQLFDLTYAVVDADGDSVTGGLTILVNDDTPQGSNNPVAVFDDDALLGGNPGGVGDVSPDTAFTSGRLDYKFGADGGFITWLTSGAPVGFTYESSGTDLLIKQGSTTVMTLSVNPLNGDYSVVQNASIMHTTGMNENSQDFTVTYQVTDNDGDFELGPLYIVVNDDTPTIVRNNVVQLDDDLMAGGNPGGLGDASPDTVNTTGTLGHLFGADGAGSISWLTTGAPAGFTYEASGVDLLVKQGATTVLTLSVDTLSGAYSVVQNAALIHPTGLDENNQALIISYSVMDADGDAASGQLVVVVNDDTPTVTRNDVVMFDDDALSGGNPNGTGDMNPDIEFASGTVNFSAGADGIGSIEWLNTGAPAGFTYLVEDEVLQVLQGSVNVMTLTLDRITGEYSVVQNAPIQHENDLNENNFAFIVGYKVLDSDNDSAIGELVIVVNDDTPVVLSVADLVFANTDNPIPGGTSTFSYSIGADSRTSFSAVNSDFHMYSLTGQIGLNSITNTSITWASESATQAVFMLEFDYLPSEFSNESQQATGTLSFNKVDGTYTVSLSEPIQSYSILTTSEALSYTGYQPESSSTDNTQPAVAVAALSNNVYAQFTGVSEPGGGTGSNNLQAVGVDGNGNTFTDGELITQASTWVTTSNSANGVAGDTIQKGEVLDFDLFSANPFGFTNTEPTAFANELFLKFDGIGTEDLVVILKLIDTDTSVETTKAIIIDNGDILKVGNTITPTYGITLDNNDGAVILQANDFNAAGENYLISGAQILVSTEGLTGSGINFVSGVGDLGASTGTQSFGATTTDNDVIKISDIGLVTSESATLDLALEITLAVKDTDADVSDTQQLGIVVASAPETLMDLAAHSGSMGLVEHLS